MEKFSLEFKKVVSEKYLEGELSLKSVARMYGISPCTVRKWAYAAKWHLNRSQFGIRIDHDLAFISDHS
ncbi:helix-turn-helix domain-containing protein, partial [Escherichia coli]|uniref:helix-turn-helix domain-containing protein n=1 Tax=Escherichia coli TaxID=562 RepID=UPI001FCE4F7A